MNGRALALAATVAVLGLWCGAVRGQEPAADRFAAANDLYRQGRFAEAAAAYEALGATGTDSVLLYNLGNARFKQHQAGGAEGALGAAIAGWERALRADPGDHDARANLAFARTLLADRFDAEADAGGVQRALARWYQAPATHDLEVVAVGLAWLLGLALLAFGRARREAAAETLFWALFVLVPVTALAVGWAGLRAWSDEARAEAVVLARQVEVRSAPMESATLVFTLHEGSTVSVVRDSPGWAQITLPNGFAGWIRGEALARID